MSSIRHIGLYFGSFNPIHIGHLAIANIIQQKTELDQVWFMVSPQNPLKKESGLLPFEHRFAMTKIALAGANNLVAKDIEAQLPTPSYTVQTLSFLKDEFPDCDFSIIMGGDNLEVIKLWKNYEELLSNYTIWAYQRPGAILDSKLKNMVQIVEAPQMEISSTYIREMLSEGYEVPYLMPEGVYSYIIENGLEEQF